MYVIYDSENGLWLSSVGCKNVWEADVEQAMTWDTEEAAKAAADAAGICSCWVIAK
jgi:hypothetical protein